MLQAEAGLIQVTQAYPAYRAKLPRASSGQLAGFAYATDIAITELLSTRAELIGEPPLLMKFAQSLGVVAWDVYATFVTGRARPHLHLLAGITCAALIADAAFVLRSQLNSTARAISLGRWFRAVYPNARAHHLRLRVAHHNYGLPLYLIQIGLH
jgi:hypothetical protein